jgi:hypothetical protein
MEQFTFVSRDGQRTAITGLLDGDVITVNSDNPFADPTGGTFERPLPGGRAELYDVVTYAMKGTAGFGCAYQVKLKPAAIT